MYLYYARYVLIIRILNVYSILGIYHVPLVHELLFQYSKRVFKNNLTFFFDIASNF